MYQLGQQPSAAVIRLAEKLSLRDRV